MRDFLHFFRPRFAAWWAAEQHVYLGSSVMRIPAAIIIPLVISAAFTAGSIGLEYLIAKRQKASPIDRGKQDDIRVSLPGYGEAITWSRGLMRGAPVWTWHTKIVDRPLVTPGHSGGKGPPKPPSGQLTEHQYYTSLHGVFHDGEIQSVRRIWFNSDLAWNLVNLSSTRYEAESATLGGSAAITAASYASNGAGVTHLGTGGGDNGYVDFAINAGSSGQYDLAISYQLDTGSMDFEVRLDGALQDTVSCPASGSGLIAIQTTELTISSGAHTLRLGNTSTHSPNLDCIDLVETVSFDGDLTDTRIFTGLTDTTISPPADQHKPWPGYNALPIELGEDGTPLAGTSTLTANLSKWGNPQIRIYRGTLDQEADPAIIADKGVDNVPAWRGLACIVIQDLLISNGIPNVTIEWEQGVHDVDQIVEDLYALGAVDNSNLELSALAGLTIPGVVRTSQKPVGETLKDLQTRFQFDMIEVDGVVKAVMRNRTNIDFSIHYTELRAHLAGSEMPAQDAVITDADPLLLPGEVLVSSLDQAMDYHTGPPQSSGVALDPFRQDVQTISLALVETPPHNEALALTLMHKAEMESRSFAFETGPKYFPVIPGSVGELVLPNATHTVRIGDGKYGLPVGVNQFNAVRQAASIYDATGHGAVVTAEQPIAGFPSNTKAIILDGPLFRPEDAGDGTDPVWYVGFCGIGGGAWPGCAMFQESPLGSDHYEFVTTASLPSSIGVTDGTLASVTDATVWDEVSTLTINFYYDPELSNASTGDVEANVNLNLLAIKNPSSGLVECIQFANATPGTASSPFVAQYTIDTLLRGRFESQNNVGEHTAADEVVFIDSTIKPRRQPKELIGQVLNIKAETSGQQLENVPVISETLHGYSLQPLAISDVIVNLDAFGDFLTSFTPHTRRNEEPATFSVDAYNSDFTVLKGTLPVTAGTNHACLMNAARVDGGGASIGNPPDETPLPGSAGTVQITTAMDRNNLFSLPWDGFTVE